MEKCERCECAERVSVRVVFQLRQYFLRNSFTGWWKDSVKVMHMIIVSSSSRTITSTGPRTRLDTLFIDTSFGPWVVMGNECWGVIGGETSWVVLEVMVGDGRRSVVMRVME